MLYGTNGISNFYSNNLTGTTATTVYSMSIYTNDIEFISNIPMSLTSVNSNHSTYNVQLSGVTNNTFYNYKIFDSTSTVEDGILFITGNTPLFSGTSKSVIKKFVKR